MADDNFVEQKPQSNPVDQIATDVGLPEQPTSVPGPATQENQSETAESQEDKELVKKKVNMLARNTGRKAEDIDELEARELIMRDIEKEEAREKFKQDELSKKRSKEEAEEAAAIERYKILKQKHIDRGLTFKERPEFEAVIAQREQESEAATQLASNKMEEESRKQQEIQQFQQQQLVKQEQEVLATENAKIEAQEKEAGRQVVKKQEQDQKIEQKLVEEDDAVELNNFDDYWNSRSTGQKIMAGIGMLLGAFGAGKSGKNAAVESIKKTIEDDIKARNLSTADEWKAKEHALKVTSLKLKETANRIQNKKIKMEIEKSRHEMGKSADQARVQRVIQAKLAQSKPMTRQEMFDLKSADPKLKEERFIAVGDELDPNTGEKRQSFMYAPVGGIEDLKKTRESIVMGRKATTDMKRLLEITELPLGGKLDLFTTKPEAQALVQSLIGNMRLELFGPGVLTEVEQAIAKNILATSTDFTKIPKAARSSINTMVKKMRYGVKQQLESVGIISQPTDNDRNVARLMNAGLSKSSAINTLIKQNKWKEETLTGF